MSFGLVVPGVPFITGHLRDAKVPAKAVEGVGFRAVVLAIELGRTDT